MKENKGSNELLLLFDGIGLLITTVALMLVYSKVTGTLDTNLVIASLFFFGIKLLVIGIADVVGFGRKIIFGIVFITVANAILIGINLIMAFGIGNMLLLISAGADLLVILLIRIIWNNRKQPSVKERKTDHADDLSGIALEEDEFDIFRSSNAFEELPSKSDSQDATAEVFDLPETLPADTFEEDGFTYNNENEPEVSGDIESLDSFLLQENVEDGMKQPAEFIIEDEVLPEPEASDLPSEDTTLRPTDIPNLEALDAFFDEPAAVVSEAAEAAEDLPDQAVSAVSDSVNSLDQELSLRIQELHDRLDDLEAREANLKKRERAMEQTWQKHIELRPQEVILDDEDSEIIINEEDLELLKDYIRRGNKL